MALEFQKTNHLSHFNSLNKFNRIDSDLFLLYCFEHSYSLRQHSCDKLLVTFGIKKKMYTVESS